MVIKPWPDTGGSPVPQNQVTQLHQLTLQKSIGNIPQMPSAADFQIEANALALVSKYVILVQEHLGILQPGFGSGTHNVLTAATYTLHFTVTSVAGVRTLACVDIWTGVKGGSLPLYFLPWCQNAATTMTLPAGGPDIFMTSMLSGCTVQVTGPAAGPTITHANASDKYNEGYTRNSKWMAGGDATSQQVHDFAETRSNSIATGAINNMLPAAVGVAQTVRKSDYAGRCNETHLLRAQRQFIDTLPANKGVSQVQVQKIGPKPKTGAFVFGLRDAHNNWAFWYQAAVEVEIDLEDKFTIGGPVEKLTMDSFVLGQPTRFYP
jgi:hypothetical protein